MAVMREVGMRAKNTLVTCMQLYNVQPDWHEMTENFGAHLLGQTGICTFLIKCFGCRKDINYTENVLYNVLHNTQVDLIGAKKTGHESGRSISIHWSESGRETIPLASLWDTKGWCHMQLIPMIISSRMRSKMGDLATTNQIIPLLWKAWTLQECPTEDKKEQLSYLCQGMPQMWQPQQLWDCMLRQNQTKIKEGRKCLFYAQHTAVQQVLVNWPWRA